MKYIGPYGQFGMISGWIIFAAICLRHSKRRSWFPLRAVLSVIGCLLLNILLDSVGENIIFYYILLVAIFVCIRLCYRNTIWQTLLVLGVAYAMQYIMYSLWLILSVLLVPDFAFYENKLSVNLLYFAVLTVMIAVTWAVTRGFKHFTELEKYSSPVVIIFTVVILVTGFLCNQINTFTDWNTIVIARLLSSIICALGVWLAIDFLVNQKIKRENTLKQYIIERQKEEFELRKETLSDINIKCHDLKYQIREIYNRVGARDASGLEEIEDSIQAFQNSYKTGNEALDIVLSEKAKACTNKEIAFNFMGDGTLISFMNDTDIYRLFNNAIDNAIEASEKIEKEKRIIGVVLDVAGPFVSIHFENYYNGQLEFSGETLLTSKGDKLNHGFGVKSIQAIADSYDAQLSINHDDEVFSLTLLLPNPKNQ